MRSSHKPNHPDKEIQRQTSLPHSWCYSLSWLSQTLPSLQWSLVSHSTELQLTKVWRLLTTCAWTSLTWREQHVARKTSAPSSRCIILWQVTYKLTDRFFSETPPTIWVSGSVLLKIESEWAAHDRPAIKWEYADDTNIVKRILQLKGEPKSLEKDLENNQFTDVDQEGLWDRNEESLVYRLHVCVSHLREAYPFAKAILYCSNC